MSRKMISELYYEAWQSQRGSNTYSKERLRVLVANHWLLSKTIKEVRVDIEKLQAIRDKIADAIKNNDDFITEEVKRGISSEALLKDKTILIEFLNDSLEMKRVIIHPSGAIVQDVDFITIT